MTSSRSGPRAELAALARSALPDAAARAQPGAARGWPALLARHRDLAALRHDYPLVLTAGAGAELPVQSLTQIVDGVLQQIAPRGPEGDLLRRHALRLEQEIRRLLAGGAEGTLSELWRRATEALLAGATAATGATLADNLERARRAVKLDGALLDCRAAAPQRFVGHLWRTAEAVRTRQLADKIQQLILRLRALLRTDLLESPEGRTPERLARSFGPPYARVIDFAALARTLDGGARGTPLSERRRRRLRAALEVLETQRFVPVAAAPAPVQTHEFAFDSCRDALAALDQRLPEMAALIKAMGIAELELTNDYRDAVHDPVFARFDANALTPADLAWFPRYFVMVRDPGVPAERSAVLDALSAGLPLKIVVQFDDIVEDLPLTGGKLALGRKRPQFAGMALGLHSAFVLQASSSHLYRMRQKVQRGVGSEGPALFCVYSGCGANTADLPPYLVAAAAVESRAFPLFTYDPSTGRDWAARLDISDNPQPAAEWPVHTLEYEGSGHQRIAERAGFTFADFAACDQRHAARLAAVEPSRPPAERLSVADYLQRPAQAGTTAVVALVDASGALRKFAVGEELIQATRRCADTWRGLQELGGGRPRADAAALAARAAPSAVPAARPAPPPVAATPAAAAAPAPAAAAAGEAYIETPRCTTCEECIQINSRMFVYDENKQARIADPNAGPYRDLVEAAESCQVSIIHPGAPRNPDEPGLEELIRRAAPFQ